MAAAQHQIERSSKQSWDHWKQFIALIDKVWRRLVKLTNDPRHSAHSLFNKLPSNRWYWSIQSRNSRLKNNFYLQVLQSLTNFNTNTTAVWLYTQHIFGLLTYWDYTIISNICTYLHNTCFFFIFFYFSSFCCLTYITVGHLNFT